MRSQKIKVKKDVKSKVVMIGSHGVERETTIMVPSDHLKITKLTDWDGIQAYLVTLERLMKAYKVQK